MRLRGGLTKGCLIVAGLVGSTWLPGAVPTLGGHEKPRPRALRARAIVEGAPGSGIRGVVYFRESRGNAPLPGVDVVAKISGPVGSLTPGRHGMHIHEVGACAPTFAAAGGHFDPGPSSDSNPDANHPFHMGDIPNLVVDEDGVGTLAHRTSRITLSPGPLSVFDANGSAVILHLNTDQGITGPMGSGVSGGPRIACGIIELVLEDHD